MIHQVVTALAFPMVKLGLNQIDPLAYAFFRFTLTSIILIPILFMLRRRKPIPRPDNIRIFVIGLLIIILNQAVFIYGQSLTSAGHSSLLFATLPIFIYVLAIFFLKEKATFRRTTGILIAAVGVYIILAGGKARFGTEYLLGDTIVLVAVVAWAVATIMVKPLTLKYGAFRVIGLALVYGSVVYAPYGLYRALNSDYSAVTWVGYVSVGYLVLFVSILAYFLWYWVLKYMEASRVAVIQNIQPIIASGVAAVVLSETISKGFVLGGIIVIAGVILTEIK
ncbi:MAG: DMT family transporter [Candidatus Zixiibacteriota bacterium]